MRPAEGDPELLLRAAGRAGRLVAELAGIESMLGAAAARGGMQWSGAAASAFGASAFEHRRAVADARVAVEQLEAAARTFAGDLADAQRIARTTDPQTGQQAESEARIALSRRRFRSQLRAVHLALTGGRLRLAEPASRWTGPVVLPPGLGPRAVPLPAPAHASPVQSPPLSRGAEPPG